MKRHLLAALIGMLFPVTIVLLGLAAPKALTFILAAISIIILLSMCYILGLFFVDEIYEINKKKKRGV